MQFIKRFFVLSLFCLGFAPATARACASCGCSLSSDWQEANDSRFKFDLRYDDINQNQLRSGTGTISPGAASQLTNAGQAQEVEQYTLNRYVTASMEMAVDPDWKVGVIVPYIMRSHGTLGTGSDGTTGTSGGGQYTSNTSNLGDLRLVTRYQGFSPEHNWGITFGAKLPTGVSNLTGTSTDPTSATPIMIDPGLQPGTGTTDALLGMFYSRTLNKNWDSFVEGLYQTAIIHNSQYIPGNSLNASLGLRYAGWEQVAPQAQINARFVQHDNGSIADVYSTGGTLIYLSPGAVVPFDGNFDVYAFVQIPIYQNVLGVQLTPTSTESLGVRYSF
jgi:hypothetical protein